MMAHHSQRLTPGTSNRHQKAGGEPRAAGVTSPSPLLPGAAPTGVSAAGDAQEAREAARGACESHGTHPRAPPGTPDTAKGPRLCLPSISSLVINLQEQTEQKTRQQQELCKPKGRGANGKGSSQKESRAPRLAAGDRAREQEAQGAAGCSTGEAQGQLTTDEA